MNDRPNTKENILKSAKKLFSINGMTGTSIREISTEADVNVAAINYHFGNKEALYQQVLKECFDNFSTSINEIASNVTTTKNFIWELYAFLSKDRETSIATFKMLIDDAAVPPNENQKPGPKKYIGPPGGETLATVIESELKIPLSWSSLVWASNILISRVMFDHLILRGPLIKKSKIKANFYNDELIKKRLEHCVKATLDYITNNQESFTDEIE